MKRRMWLCLCLLSLLMTVLGCAVARQWAMEQGIALLEEQTGKGRAEIVKLVGEPPGDDAPETTKLAWLMKAVSAVSEAQQKPPVDGKPALPDETKYAIYAFLLTWFAKNGVMLYRKLKNGKKT